VTMPLAMPWLYCCAMAILPCASARCHRIEQDVCMCSCTRTNLRVAVILGGECASFDVWCSPGVVDVGRHGPAAFCRGASRQ
jgi:hypothetical protein